MALTKYVPLTRLGAEKVTLRNNQFARFLSRRTGVPQAAISQALRIVGEGIIQALAEGFDFQWMGLGTFETRELAPRTRYHRLKKECYTSLPSVIVHFRKALALNDSVRALAAARIDNIVDKPTVTPMGRK